MVELVRVPGRQHDGREDADQRQGALLAVPFLLGGGGGVGERHQVVSASPPSTPMMFPVIQEEWLRDSRTTASATSSGRVSRWWGVVPRRELDQLLVAGYALQRRRQGHAAPQRVDRHSARREFERQLADVGLQRALGGGHGTVAGGDLLVAGARHRVDLRAAAEQSGPVQVLGPVHEGVRHHVERHVHLTLGQRLGGLVRQVGREASEGQGVQQDLQGAAAGEFGDLRDQFGPGGGARGVQIEEVRRHPGRSQFRRGRLGPLLPLGGVEVHPQDVGPFQREGLGGGQSDPAGSSEDEVPGALKWLRHDSLLLSSRRGRPSVDGPGGDGRIRPRPPG